MKIRIFALAKELDMDSRLLIEHCAKAGIMVKNSALASISPEERDRVLAIIRGTGSTAVMTATGPEAARLPQREEQARELAGAVRKLRDMIAKSPIQRSGAVTTTGAGQEPAPAFIQESNEGEDEVVSGDEDFSDTEDEVAEVVAVAETDPVDDEIQSPAGDEPTAESPTADPAPAAPVVEAKASGASTTAAPVAPPRVPGAPERPAMPSRMPAGQMRAVGSRPMRDMGMSSRGTPSRGDQGQGGGAATPPVAGRGNAEPPVRPRGNVPGVANLGTFSGPPVTRKEEAKPQAPEIRINKDGKLVAATPLGGHMAGGGRRGVDDKIKIGGPGDSIDTRGGKRGDKNPVGAGMEEIREARRVKRTKDVRGSEEEEAGQRKALRKMIRRPGQKQSAQLKTFAEIEPPLNVRSLSEAMGRPAKQILGILFKRGEMLTINSLLHEDTAVELALELGVDLRIIKPKDVEDELQEYIDLPDAPETLVDRAPIITILGHVDHGKTTLVDKLRSANVAASEHGGITQHIAAYQVVKNGQKLTFVDTPGHAAFGEMRARGANVTDIIVLVVAANDGVMPQTVECIAHAKAAGVPLVVALNKVDLPDRNEQRVLQELAAQNVLAAEWGGDTEVVRTSGLSGEGLDTLLETLLLTAELNEFKANPERPATGACLEAFRDEGRGPLAWLIVQKGTLRKGDVVLCGQAYGKVRAIFNEKDQEIDEAPPSTPVMLAGLDIVPAPGDKFVVLNDLDLARDIAERRRMSGRQTSLAARGGKRTLEDILNAARDGEVQDLGVIIKADTPGSLEALRSEIGKFEHPEVRVRILHEGVGGVNESDVYLASASSAIIIAFHVIPDDRAASLAMQEDVEIRRYNIIYEVVDEIKQTLEGMLKPAKKEVTLGRAIVLQTFSISRFGTIAGCRVLNGTIDRSNRIHVIRDQKVLNSYAIASLRREKDDARDVREGMECGIRLEGFNDVKEGDLLEAYKIEEVKRTFES
ncbi:MAG: translation initiation factor IF-2 [Planctomyces sp.]|nr:translation initiation factor IF-2 [Planctomyces sp.]